MFSLTKGAAGHENTHAVSGAIWCSRGGGGRGRDCGIREAEKQENMPMLGHIFVVFCRGGGGGAPKHSMPAAKACPHRHAFAAGVKGEGREGQ